MMSKTLVASCLVVLASLSTVSAFEYFAFTLQWPITNGCSDCKNPMFTIHGMWPSSYSGEQPSYCGGTFDPNAIASIQNELETAWPSYQGQDDSFWSHEYEKHGTCAKSSPGMATEFGFFNTTLTFYDELDVMSVLSQAGITASNSQSYRVSDIQSAFNSAYGSTPQVDCRDGEITTLTFCLTPGEMMENCQGQGCSSEYVRIPESGNRW